MTPVDARIADAWQRLGKLNQFALAISARQLPKALGTNEKADYLMQARMGNRRGVFVVTPTRVFFMAPGIISYRTEDLVYGKIVGIEERRGLMAWSVTIRSQGAALQIDDVMAPPAVFDGAMALIRERIS